MKKKWYKIFESSLFVLFMPEGSVLEIISQA